MFVPFISNQAPRKVKTLYPRKGGGGGGRGGGGGGGEGGGGGGGKSSGSAGGVGGSTHPESTPVSVGGNSRTATAFGAGGGRPVTIPAGQLFAGRESGGGTRGEVYGTSQYGSGYPGSSQRGVAGLGFPFVFWPLVWGGVGFGAGSYLHTSEYGRPDNSSRPGGPLTTATFVSSSNSNTTFRLLADNTTTISLISNIQANCSNNLNNGSSSFISTPYNDSLSSLPQPEQTVQYYRASTVALTLDGYNNTADFESEGTPDVPLPSNIDTTLLNCLNTTIGNAVPLIDGAPGLMPNLTLLGMMYTIWTLVSLF